MSTVLTQSCGQHVGARGGGAVVLERGQTGQGE